MKSLSHGRLQAVYLGFLLVVFALLSFQVLSGFLVVLSLAYVAAVLVLPVYEYVAIRLKKIPIIKNMYSVGAASITMFLLILFIITPVLIMLALVLHDAQNFYGKVSTEGINFDVLSQNIQHHIALYVPDAHVKIDTIASAVSSFFVTHIGNFFSGTLDLLVKVFIFFLALFFFLKDKEYFVSLYARMNPLDEEDNAHIFHAIKQSVHSIIIGSMVVALVQGVAAGVGFYLLGVPNPFFFGSLGCFVALIPGIGPFLLWIPSAIYLYLTSTAGHNGLWIGQILWGIVVISGIDNILRPYMLNKGTQMHPIFILLSVIGGITVFGPEGFLFGPLVLSMCIVISTMWVQKGK